MAPYSVWLRIYGMVAHMAFAHRRPGRRAGGARTSRRGRRTRAYSNRQQYELPGRPGYGARARTRRSCAAGRRVRGVRPRRASVAASRGRVRGARVARVRAKRKVKRHAQRVADVKFIHKELHVYPRHAITQQCSDGTKPAGRSTVVVTSQSSTVIRSVTQRATAPSPPGRSTVELVAAKQVQHMVHPP